MQCYRPLCSPKFPCSSASGDHQCSVGGKLTAPLRMYFGSGSFRIGQRESALSAIHGNVVFVRMAIGAGKSLSVFSSPYIF